MAIGNREIQLRMKRFEEVCRNSGVKMTHQRMEIFREVAKTGEHPDAENVHKGVRRRMPTVSLDTVYRTLWLLKDLGLVTTLGSPRGRTRFDANLNPHHHFVCRRCGRTRDFYSHELDALQLPETVKDFGHIETTHVEAKGVCLECTAGIERKNLHQIKEETS